MIWNIGLIFSIYKIIFEEYVVFEEQCVNFGVLGQNGINMVVICEGEEIGQIWGFVYVGVGEDGVFFFEDINGDGQVIGDQGNVLNLDVDFIMFGNGIFDLEFGWIN